MMEQLTFFLLEMAIGWFLGGLAVYLKTKKIQKKIGREKLSYLNEVRG